MTFDEHDDELDDDLRGRFDAVDAPRPLPEELRQALLASHAQLEAAAALEAAASRRPLPFDLRRRLVGAAHTGAWTRAAAVAVVVLLVAGGVAATRGGGRPSQSLDVAASRATTTTARSSAVDSPEPEAPPATEPPTTTTEPQRGSQPSRPSRAAPRESLVLAASCDDLLASYREQALRLVTAYGVEGGPAAMPVATAAAGGPAGGGDEAVPYSRTNAQEEGVDEPDMVQTDGRRLFVLDHETDGLPVLRSLVVGGEGIALASTVEVPVGTTSLLLDGDRLLVIGAEQDGRTPRAAIRTYDVADPSRPRLVHVRTVEGYVVASRLASGVARIVVHTPPKGPVYTYPKDDSAAERRRAEEENRRLVRASTLDDWLPRMTAEDHRSGTPAVTHGRVCDCDESMRPQEFSGFGHVTVLTIDPGAPERVDAASVQGAAHTVYASTSALFATTTVWKGDRAAETFVHRFTLDGDAPAAYDVSGSVPGVVLDQFSMSEHGGHLRVATTTATNDSTESRVTVLRRSGDRLAEVGSVGGLGRGERIYAVRFIETTGYVVTFRQVDPLYVIDLRDPTKPRVTGELKITGYSAYLHPTDPGRILGVGQEATEEGRRVGAQVSLFDVSDPSSPRRADQELLGEGATSFAEFDHHAFLWWAPTRTVAIPVVEHANERGEEKASASAVVLRATPDELHVQGRVTHAAHVSQWQEGIIQRTLVLGTSLVTVSPGGLLVSDIGTLAERQWVAL